SSKPSKDDFDTLILLFQSPLFNVTSGNITSTTSSSSAFPTTSESSARDSDRHRWHGSRPGTIVACVLGALFGVLLLVFAVWFWRRKHRRKNATKVSIPGADLEENVVSPVSPYPLQAPSINSEQRRPQHQSVFRKEVEALNRESGGGESLNRQLDMINRELTEMRRMIRDSRSEGTIPPEYSSQ
ncbi:hypothetical protein V5O48_017522, partial [Marasmius crinis-equi]